MEKLDEQKIRGFGKYKDTVFHYTRYIDKIEIEKKDIYDFYCRITIYKDGTFNFKAKGLHIYNMNQSINLFYNEKYDYSKKYDYYSVRDFMETNKSENIKFSYLHKMLDDLYEISFDDYMNGD